MPGKAVAHRNNTDAAKIIDAGLALIRDNSATTSWSVSSSPNAAASSSTMCIGSTSATHATADYVEAAKAYYRGALPCAARAAVAASFLRELRHPHEPITAGQATAMIYALFASMTGKLREDEAAMAKLAGCVDIFSPANNALALALELWEPVSTHPLSLVLAIKELKANKTFEPNEAELREALGKVETKSAGLERDAREWLIRLRRPTR